MRAGAGHSPSPHLRGERPAAPGALPGAGPRSGLSERGAAPGARTPRRPAMATLVVLVLTILAAPHADAQGLRATAPLASGQRSPSPARDARAPGPRPPTTLVRRLRAALHRTRGLSVTVSGDVRGCTLNSIAVAVEGPVPPGPLCMRPRHARVREMLLLHGGRVAGELSRVAVPRRPMLSDLLTPVGAYRLSGPAGCWTQLAFPPTLDPQPFLPPGARILRVPGHPLELRLRAGGMRLTERLSARTGLPVQVRIDRFSGGRPGRTVTWRVRSLPRAPTLPSPTPRCVARIPTAPLSQPEF